MSGHQRPNLSMEQRLPGVGDVGDVGAAEEDPRRKVRLARLRGGGDEANPVSALESAPVPRRSPVRSVVENLAQAVSSHAGTVVPAVLALAAVVSAAVVLTTQDSPEVNALGKNTDGSGRLRGGDGDADIFGRSITRPPAPFVATLAPTHMAVVHNVPRLDGETEGIIRIDTSSSAAGFYKRSADRDPTRSPTIPVTPSPTAAPTTAPVSTPLAPKVPSKAAPKVVSGSLTLDELIPQLLAGNRAKPGAVTTRSIPVRTVDGRTVPVNFVQKTNRVVRQSSPYVYKKKPQPQPQRPRVAQLNAHRAGPGGGNRSPEPGTVVSTGRGPLIITGAQAAPQSNTVSTTPKRPTMRRPTEAGTKTGAVDSGGTGTGTTTATRTDTTTKTKTETGGSTTEPRDQDSKIETNEVEPQDTETEETRSETIPEDEAEILRGGDTNLTSVDHNVTDANVTDSNVNVTDSNTTVLPTNFSIQGRLIGGADYHKRTVELADGTLRNVEMPVVKERTVEHGRVVERERPEVEGERLIETPTGEIVSFVGGSAMEDDDRNPFFLLDADTKSWVAGDLKEPENELYLDDDRAEEEQEDDQEDGFVDIRDIDLVDATDASLVDAADASTLFPLPVVENSFFPAECPPTNQSALEDYHAPGGEDEAIYEIYYSNPRKSCGTVVEIGAGDGKRFSRSFFFERALGWRSLLIEADPHLHHRAIVNRPDARVVHGAFCDGSTELEYKDGSYRGTAGQGEVLSIPHGEDAFSTEDAHSSSFSSSAHDIVPCVSLVEEFQKHGITKIDVLYVVVDGDALAVVRKMDWTVRVDVWVIELDGYEDRNDVVRTVLTNNDYVKAEWAISRWCNPYMMGRCMPNEVWLAKGFNPLPVTREDVEGGRRRLQVAFKDTVNDVARTRRLRERAERELWADQDREPHFQH